jgi:RNA polymerase sigma-70 factor, ECF subfamily
LFYPARKYTVSSRFFKYSRGHIRNKEEIDIMDEFEAISRVLAGEREAFEFIVNKYQPALLTLAWGVLGNKEEAKDVTQDALVRAYLNLNGFDLEKSFKNWIYSITFHQCLDKKRREKLSQHYLQKASKELSASQSGDSPGQRMEENEYIHTILQKLNKNERLAISLTVNDGYTASEVAKVLDCAENTARVYLFNAKRKLRKLVERNRYV